MYEFILCPNGTFSAKQTFECGQCFRWNDDGFGNYVGVFGHNVAKITDTENGLIIKSNTNSSSEFIKYLDLERNYDLIRQQVSFDEQTHTAAEFGAGIHILRQEPWEALCSFIISQCNNIPRIKGIISKLSDRLGDELEFDGEVYHSFPSANTVAELPDCALDFLRSGYRAPYILHAARRVASGEINLNELYDMPTAEAKKILLSLNGVGEKVASCMLLFGLGKLDAFPIDVWVKRAIASMYGKSFDYANTFGEYAGIAQQYIFYYARENKIAI